MTNFNKKSGDKELLPELSKGEFLVYRADDGSMKLEVRLEQETVWLTQQMMADLFQTTKQNIGQHRRNIFSRSHAPAWECIPPRH